MPKMNDTNFELLLRQKQERRRASDLTELLMVSMQVKPSARYLIDMFNDTPHNTIQEALVVWVKKEIADYGWDVPYC